MDTTSVLPEELAALLPEGFVLNDALFAALGGIILGIAVLGLAVAVLMIVADWKIYRKAGVGGWKCLIPIYNLYTEVKFSWRPAAFWRYFLYAILFYVCVGEAQYLLEVNPIYGYIATAAMLIFGILWVILAFRMVSHLSRCFGHGFWFTLGLIFFPVIFLCVLAFGKSQYVGPIRRRKAE